MVFLACVHLALFLASSLSPGNSLVSSWCDHGMLASLLSRRLTVFALYLTISDMCLQCVCVCVCVMLMQSGTWRRRFSISSALCWFCLPSYSLEFSCAVMNANPSTGRSPSLSSSQVDVHAIRSSLPITLLQLMLVLSTHLKRG